MRDVHYEDVETSILRDLTAYVSLDHLIGVLYLSVASFFRNLIVGYMLAVWTCFKDFRCHARQ